MADTRALLAMFDEPYLKAKEGATGLLAGPVTQEEKQLVLDAIGSFYKMERGTIRMCMAALVMQQLCIDLVENPTNDLLEHFDAKDMQTKEHPRLKVEHEVHQVLMSFMSGPFISAGKLMAKNHIKLNQEKDETKIQ